MGSSVFNTMSFLPLVCISFTIPHLCLIHWDLPLSSSKLWVESWCKSISGYHLSNWLLSPLSYPPPQGSSVLDMTTGSSHCLYLIQQHLKTSLQGLTCISTPSSFCPLSLSRFLFLFLFHFWPLNLLRFRAFFHWQQWPIACIWCSSFYAVQPVTCIWYSNLPSSHLASLQNVLCLWLCQFMFRYDEFHTTRLHLFYNPSSVFDTLRFAFVFIQALSRVVV